MWFPEFNATVLCRQSIEGGFYLPYFRGCMLTKVA